MKLLKFFKYFPGMVALLVAASFSGIAEPSSSADDLQRCMQELTDLKEKHAALETSLAMLRQEVETWRSSAVPIPSIEMKRRAQDLMETWSTAKQYDAINLIAEYFSSLTVAQRHHFFIEALQPVVHVEKFAVNMRFEGSAMNVAMSLVDSCRDSKMRMPDGKNADAVPLFLSYLAR